MIQFERDIFAEMPYPTLELKLAPSAYSIGFISGWSTDACHIYGYAEDEIIGRPAETLLLPTVPDTDKKALLRLQNGITVRNFETIAVRKDSFPIIVSLSFYPIWDISHHSVLGAYGYGHDVTSFFSFNTFFDSLFNKSLAAPSDSHEDLHQALHQALNTENAKLYLRRLYGRNQDKPFNVLQTIARGLEIYDYYTYGHSERVVQYALEIGAVMHLDRHEMQALEVAASVHDIGKLGVEGAILHKKGKLSESEMTEIKRHSYKGARLLDVLGFEPIVVDAVKGHHERFDGQGYPDHLAGEQIPLLARVLCLADAYDAMTSERIYKHKLEPYEAYDEVTRCIGKQFCPQVAEAFLEHHEI